MSALPPAGPPAPVSEAELHAFADGQLDAARQAEVAAFLAGQPEAAAQVQAWQQQNQMLHRLLDPVLQEALPLRLPLQPPQRSAPRWPWQALAAGVLLALVGGGSGWWLRGAVGPGMRLGNNADKTTNITTANTPPSRAAALHGFAERAAVAHAVYSPEQRRPVELGADQEQALVTWLTKRLGTPVRAPALGAVGYQLMGGRLLPGGQGPVAQFMYQASPPGAAAGAEGGAGVGAGRLSLYVSREVAQVAADHQPAFHMGRQNGIAVFYWVDANFGYALAGQLDAAQLQAVSAEVYRQLEGR